MVTQYRLFKWDGHDESTLELEEESCNKQRIENSRRRKQRIYPENKYRIIPKKLRSIK